MYFSSQKVWSTFALLLFFSICYGQQFKNPICWKISKDNKNPSYILGSIHLMDTTQISFPIDLFCKLIDECQVTCFEIKLSTQTNINNDLEIFLDDNETNITNSLSNDELMKLNSIIDSSNYFLKPIKSLLEYIKPTALTALLEMEQQMQTTEKALCLSFSPDLYFQQYALSKGYPVFELETFDKQKNWILPKISFEEAIQELRNTISTYGTLQNTDLHTIYIKQNFDELKNEVINDSIMIHRNLEMAKNINHLITTNNQLFIMIGAAHLPFEIGILKHLETMGYSIDPIEINLQKNQRH